MLFSAILCVFALIEAGKSIQPSNFLIAFVLYHEKCHLSVSTGLVLCEYYTLELRVHEIKTQLSVLLLMDVIVMAIER